MKLNFLESGIDSLNKGFTYLSQYEDIQFNNASKIKNRKRFFYLKDAILMIQHGIEILFKQLIQRHSEYLVFSQIDENVKKALKEKNERGLKSVFEGQFKHKIHTITFMESIERLKVLPKVKLNPILEKKVRELELYRNIIMHSQPHLNEADINYTFDGLANELDTFFYTYLGKSYKTISGYSTFVATFEKFQQRLNENDSALKAKANALFLSAIKYAGISIGDNELKRITNIEKCTRFVEKMFASTLSFGTDLCNGHCWGDISSVKRVEHDCFRIIADDGQVIYDFKFRSILLFYPVIDDKRSPIIFFESENLDEHPFDPKEIPELDYDGIRIFEYLICEPSGEVIRGKKEIEDFYEREDREHFRTFFRFHDRGLFCFLNIQGLEYNRNFRRLIKNFRLMDGKDFEVAIRESVKIPPQISYIKAKK